MPGDMSTPETEQIQTAGRTFLERVIPGYRPPQTVDEAKKHLEILWAKKKEMLQGVTGEERNRLEREFGLAETGERRQVGEIIVARGYFEGLEEEIRKRMGLLRQKIRDEAGRTRLEYVVGGKVISEEEARIAAATRVLAERSRGVEEVIKKINEKIEKHEKLSPEEQGEYRAARLIQEYVHFIVVCEKIGASERIAAAIRDLEGKGDDLAGLDSSEANGVVEKEAKELPDSTQLAAPVKYREVKAALEGRSTTYLGRNVAEVIRSVVRDVTGREPTPAELTAGRGLDLEREAKKRVRNISQVRAQKIIDNHALEAERKLSKAYLQDTVDSEGFREMVREVQRGERSLKEEAREKGITVQDKFDERVWLIRADWRNFAKDALPDFEGDHTVMFNAETQAGERLTSLVTKVINLEEILESLAVRQAIVRLYPRIMRGEIFFGRTGEIFVIRGGQAKKLSEIPQGELGNYGLEETVECQLACEVLRAWIVHPQRANEVAWKIYGNDHDGVARWYPAQKWGETEGYLLQRAIGREKLVEPENGSGNYWEWMMKDEDGKILPIEELVSNWERIKTIARAQGGLNLSGFYDRARKIMETANAIHELVTSGISPENVVKLIIEKERFKYLPAKERNKVWSALYTEVWKMLIERTPLTLREEKLKNIALVRNLYALRKISKEQLDELLSVVEQVPEIESFFQRILSPEGQILERGYTIFVLGAIALESFPVVNWLASLLSFGILSPKWDPKTQESDRTLVRRLGANPFSAEIAAAGLAGYLIPHVLAGSLSWGTFLPAFAAANLGAVILTNITDYLNEKRKLPVFQTQMSYKEWPLKQGTPGGAILAPVLFVPGLLAGLIRGVTTRLRGKIEEPTSESRRKFLKQVGGLSLAVLFGGLGIGAKKEKKVLEERVRKEKEFRALPEAWQEELKRREKAEKESQLYKLYKDGSYVSLLNPFDIENEMIRELVEKVGPNWMFEEARKDALNWWFGREFTSEEIFEYRADPQRLLGLLEELKEKGKISEEVVRFYRKALEKK